MSRDENRIAAGTQAKHKLSSARRQSSAPSSVNPQIDKLISNIAKHSSYAYSSAIQRSKQNPMDELQRRVFKKLRPRYSSDRFAELMLAVSKLPPLARFDWLTEEERRLNELR